MSSSGRRILVTGGAGFVGSHLTDALLKLGHRITVLDDLSSGFAENIDKQAHFVKGDVRDHALVARLINESDACFHLAAIASVQLCSQSWANSHSVNLASFVGLLECIAKRPGGVIPVVYTSSAAIYGNTDIYPAHEQLPPNPISVYGADKVGSELHAHAAGRNAGVPSFGLRPFNIYGPRQQASSPYSGVITVFADRLKRGQSLTIYGDGGQTRDFIHVADIVEFFIAALNKASPEAPVCNAATGKEIAVLAIAEKLADLLGRKADIKFEPARSGDIYRSVACTKLAQDILGYKAKIDIADGLKFIRDK